MLLAILAFHIVINYLSRKKTPSSSSSCKVRVLLSSKRGKRRVTKIKKVVMLTKQIKQETRIIMVVIFTRWTVLLFLQV